jgi:hypothetical protein
VLAHKLLLPTSAYNLYSLLYEKVHKVIQIKVVDQLLYFGSPNRYRYFFGFQFIFFNLIEYIRPLFRNNSLNKKGELLMVELLRVLKYTSHSRRINHFAKLEFLWTLVPCAILVFISVPSFSLALALDEVYRPDI